VSLERVTEVILDASTVRDCMVQAMRRIRGVVGRVRPLRQPVAAPELALAT